MTFSQFVEINPRVSLSKGEEYRHIEMELVISGHRYVRTNKRRKYTGGGSKFKTGDTLFARITPCLENGKIAQFIGEKNEVAFGSTEFFVFRAKEGISDPSYIYYLSFSDLTRKPAEKSMSGASGRQRADLKSIENLEIPGHTLEEQQKISSILSAYDDLIENNLKRIKILEEMAQMIYREWFVNFRFPEHEKVKMVKSELGMIPEGWEVRKIGEIAEIVKGKSYRGDELSEKEGVLFANLKCIDRGGGFRAEGLKRYKGKYKEEQIVKTGDIVVAVTDMSQKREIVGSGARIPETKEGMMVISLDLVKINTKDKDILQKAYLNGLIRFTTFNNQIKQYANGVNVLHLNPKVIEDFVFVLPPKNLLAQYYEITEPMVEMSDFIKMRISNLLKTRDLLLPKLISGEIDVGRLVVKTELRREQDE